MLPEVFSNWFVDLIFLTKELQNLQGPMNENEKPLQFNNFNRSFWATTPPSANPSNLL